MSPQVWNDVRQRITSVANSIGLRVTWPNEDATPPLGVAEPQPKPFLDIETAGRMMVPVEMTSRIWQEEGTVFLHLMIPTGTGVDYGFETRTLLGTAFRELTDLPEGLTYWDQTYDPLGSPTDDGVYRAFSLLIHYFYQNLYPL